MRIWIGWEQEGADTGIKTLFVESRILTRPAISLVKYYAEQTSAKRIYFGAGKKNVLCGFRFIEQLKKDGVCLVYECDKLPRKLWQNLFDTIVLRNDVKTGTISKIQSKLDNGYSVKMYKTALYTDITTVKKGKYESDIVLWGK